MFIGHQRRHGQRDDAAARLARPRSTASSWCATFSGVAAVDGEHVPVQRAAGGGGHVGEQLDLVVGELVEAALDDALERGALVLADRLAEGEQLLVGRPSATATGLPSPSECVRRQRGREAEAAGLDRLVQQRTISSICSSVAASLPTASAPIT